ncbi:hypothetical protein MTR67_022535 [Solanum verrucosum]|uniref:Retrotransposon Copia-like N-terminal domain-containing protein n=1 Tax=Solanum verrucosum TaxID=315347 RepID=A0AAF0QUU6_SOLVR|nr:hypothetical protein MTR67_022535 [Solanum verrucosum]
MRCPLAIELQNLANTLISFELSNSSGLSTHVEEILSFMDHIKVGQLEDAKLSKIHDKILQREAKEIVMDEEGLLRINGCVCASHVGDLIKTILIEAHSLRFSIHFRAIKIARRVDRELNLLELWIDELYATLVVEVKIDQNHPRYIGPSDGPGSILVPIQLKGSENYGLWRRSMCITLQAKKKLGFVLETYNKSSFDKELHEQWETCNAIVLSWLINTVALHLFSGIVYVTDDRTVWVDLQERFDKVNRVRIFQLHREITTILQGTDSVFAYFTKLKELWAEYDAIVPFSNCGCTRSKDYVDH